MDLEVAGQWRREWAGTAEYGKVTEGGVTRRVARAMEVINASAPGARVRVMRAAFHSSAGPGAPAASYMMHSSRRVITSGFNYLESPSLPTKPLEISSTPLESSPEPNTELENYKVTEPDDFDISTPSKWKSSNSGTSIRMPSEESSSTDNASIIDLDSRNHRSILRKYSYDSENSDIPPVRRSSSRASPLLDAPVALSTLKYKSLLNGSTEWNNRRKSYSFEDTSPINETIVNSNDTLGMESSTDSGICKSTEIVNDPDDKYNVGRDRQYYDKQEDTFQDWLSKNRSNSTFYKGNQFKSLREHNVVIEEPLENNITLQSNGKVSITVPMTIETEEEYQNRKVKKVEFCKTELHFAAESGKVNIIATDEKPPPTNDFRKRRSAFVPIHGNFDKPITLFGENNKEFLETGKSELSLCNKSEISDSDENTAATKSILKNKIPKPKPYLLGENMVFGSSDDLLEKKDSYKYEPVVPTAVTLINKQLQSERRYSNETTSSFSSETETELKNNSVRAIHKGPFIVDSLKLRNLEIQDNKLTTNLKTKDTRTSSPVRSQLKLLQMSPIQGRAKTRQLRDTELAYFGVNSGQKDDHSCKTKLGRSLLSETDEDVFQSVRLVQRMSNSVCNSEAESEDSPEYQNIPIKKNFAPVPTPRSRSKYDVVPSEIKPVTMFKPVIEQNGGDIINRFDSRRSRHRRQENSTTTSSRSISEPPKIGRHKPHEKATNNTQQQQKNAQANIQENATVTRFSDKMNTGKIERKPTTTNDIRHTTLTEEEEPLYTNYVLDERKIKAQRTDSSQRSSEQQRKSTRMENNVNKSERKTLNHFVRSHDGNSTNNSFKKRDTEKIQRIESEVGSLQKRQHSTRKKQRTEKLATPEYSNENELKTYDKHSNGRKISISQQDSLTKPKTEHRSRSSQRNSTSKKPVVSEELASKEENVVELRKEPKKIFADDENIEKNTSKSRNRHSSKDKTSSRKESNTHQRIEGSSTDSYRNVIKSKSKPVENIENKYNTKSDKHKSSKRSEYVINYDDKNGTVSSICKVQGSGPSKKKMILKEANKDSPREYKVKNSTSEKSALRK